jgi:hypothetical protein
MEGAGAGAPLSVQKELMRHASIRTTMNVYGKALTETKRQAYSKVLETVMRSENSRRLAAVVAVLTVLSKYASAHQPSHALYPRASDTSRCDPL